MADFKVVGQLVIDDNGQLKILDKQSKQTAKSVDKVGKSAQTADRNLKGAAQASSNSSKNFSKMAQGINGTLVPAYATLAASLFAVSALFRGLETAANIKNQIAGMEQFGAVTGKNMALITHSIRQATAGVLDFQTAAQAAAITTAAGFNAGEVEQLAEGAKLASVALGRDLTDSFNRLVRGVTKAEPELLDELGIILRLEVATEKFAIANGLAANKLTIAQKAAAVHAEVVGQLDEKYGDFRETADDLINPFSKLQTSFNDIIVGLSGFIGPLEFVADFLARNTGAAATLFAGFALSITKAAFPALQDINKGLTDYAANAQLRANEVTGAFNKNIATLKSGGVKFASSEAFKTKTFQKNLAKRGIDQKKFETMSIKSQERSIRSMIGAMTRKLNAGKKINMAEYNNLKKVHAMMLADTKITYSKIGAFARATGAGISAGIVLPAVAAQKGLANVGLAATRLAPIFTALGSLINAAFFIFTAGFIVKFIYDAIFVTEEYKKEQERLNSALEKTALELEHINNVGSQVLKEQMEKTEESVENVNKGLLRTYRLLSGLQGIEGISDFLGDRADLSLTEYNKKEKQNIREVLANQLQALFQIDQSAFKGTLKDIETTIKEAGGADRLLPKTVGGKGILDKILGLDPEKENDVARLSTLLKSLMMVLFDTGAAAGMTGQQFLGFASVVSTSNNRIEEETKTVGDLADAYDNLGETLGKVQKTYASKDMQSFSSAAELVLNALEAREKKESEGADKADKIGMLNTALGLNIQTTEDFDTIHDKLRAMVKAVAQEPGLIQERASIATDITMAGTRKNEYNVLLKQRLTEQQYAKDIEISQGKITQLIAKGIGLKGTALVNNQIEIAQENEKLRLLQLQEKEYIRANTVAGQLNDTFQNNLDEMFLKIIQGTESAKDALKQLAIVVIQEMQRIAAARLAAAMIGGMTSIFGSGTSSGQNYSPVDPAPKIIDQIPGFNPTGGSSPFGRYGGIFGKKAGYSFGGIADGPEGGYTATLHGREAVVPLPNGDKIPVEMKGGHGPINSNINITINNEGESEMTAQESSALGEAIQSAVTKEIANQQRPGGLLSPF